MPLADIATTMDDLARQIAQDFSNGQREAQQVIESEGQKYAQDVQDVLTNDFGCDTQCLSQYRWDRLNPADFANGQCGCNFPAGPQTILDWSAEDFNKVSMSEYFAINQTIGFEDIVEEVIELKDAETKTEEKTPPADGGETKTQTPPESGETPPAGGEGETPPAGDATTEGGSGAVWWILGVLAVVGLGGGGYWYKTRSSGGSGDKQEEGGQSDLYERIL
jgi:hypothetical protein